MSSAKTKRLSEIIDALPENVADRLLEVMKLYVALGEEEKAAFEMCVFPFLDLSREPWK